MTRKFKREPVKRDTQVDAWFPYYEPFTVCRLCSGPLMELGQLGRLMHYRCRNCGGEISANIN